MFIVLRGPRDLKRFGPPKKSIHEHFMNWLSKLFTKPDGQYKEYT